MTCPQGFRPACFWGFRPDWRVFPPSIVPAQSISAHGNYYRPWAEKGFRPTAPAL